MKSGLCACISSRITTVIHVSRSNWIYYNWYNEPFAVSPKISLNSDMHGLIFETSIWLLAGSTRWGCVCWNTNCTSNCFPASDIHQAQSKDTRANLHKRFHIMLPTSETIRLSNQQFQNAPYIPQGSQATLPNCTHNANPAAAHLQAQQAQESCYS